MLYLGLFFADFKSPRIYPKNLKNRLLGLAKAPIIDDRKRVRIALINTRLRSLRPSILGIFRSSRKTDFSGSLGIIHSGNGLYQSQEINSYLSCVKARSNRRPLGFASWYVLSNTYQLVIDDFSGFDALKYEFICWDWYYPTLIVEFFSGRSLNFFLSLFFSNSEFCYDFQMLFFAFCCSADGIFNDFAERGDQ